MRIGYESEASVSGISDDEDTLEDELDTQEATETEEGKIEAFEDNFEEKAVLCFRVFVLCVLLCAMAAAGAGTWFFITHDEDQDFAGQVRLTFL